MWTSITHRLCHFLQNHIKHILIREKIENFYESIHLLPNFKKRWQDIEQVDISLIADLA